jgi:hypothetical protein
VSLAHKELVEKSIKALTDNIKAVPTKDNAGGTGSDNCSHGYITKDGSTKSFHHPCHAHIRQIDAPRVYWNRYCKRPSSQVSERVTRSFFDWITSEDSPWKTFRGKATSHTPHELEKEATGQEVKNWIYENGWVWSDLEHPVNFQHSFLVASRMAAEWPKYLERWDKWVAALGSEKYRGMAFVFLTLFVQQQHQPDKYVISYANKYDWPIDTGTCGEDYIRNFIHGTPVGPWNDTFSRSSNYTPVNSIWGTVPTKAGESYIDGIFKRYHVTHGPTKEECEAFWTKEKIGLSTFQYSTKWWVSEGEIIDLIRLEYNRLHETSVEKVA